MSEYGLILAGSRVTNLEKSRVSSNLESADFDAPRRPTNRQIWHIFNDPPNFYDTDSNYS
jgi:hypothetical protein